MTSAGRRILKQLGLTGPEASFIAATETRPWMNDLLKARRFTMARRQSDLTIVAPIQVPVSHGSYLCETGTFFMKQVIRILTALPAYSDLIIDIPKKIMYNKI